MMINECLNYFFMIVDMLVCKFYVVKLVVF